MTCKKNLGLIWLLPAGAVAGAAFNLAFGTVPWNPEGILGGLLSALLIHILS